MKKRIQGFLMALLLALTLMGAGVRPALAAGSVAGNGRPYYITVNRAANVVTVYGLDRNGCYTVPVKAMICSVGKAGSVTPRGNYSLGGRRAWCHMIDGSWGQYATSFYGSYLFHSVCYSAADPAKLLTYEYNMLGGPASLGCVRLQTADAKWIYDNCAAGTKVRIYDDAASPGPLGKPEKAVGEITPALDNGWDPTDPRADNPWRAVLVSSVKLSPEKATLTAGESVTLTAAFTPSTATYPAAVWFSSDPSVAVVDGTGRVVGLKPGSAVITVSRGSAQDSCAVTVDKTLLPFADLVPGAWYYGSVRAVYEAGLMDGTGEGAFSPDLPMTRAAAERALGCLAGLEPDDSAETEPSPDCSITRQELAVMLYQCETERYGVQEGEFVPLSRFADGTAVDEDAREAMIWAVGAGLIHGTAENRLEPAAAASRAQAAAILHRYLLTAGILAD